MLRVARSKPLQTMAEVGLLPFAQVALGNPGHASYDVIAAVSRALARPLYTLRQHLLRGTNQDQWGLPPP